MSPAVCSACGLPQRKTQDGSLIFLRRCSRCKQVWYHDANCQRKHFPLHKKECKRLAAEHVSSTPANPMEVKATSADSIKSIQLRVEARAGRGNALVACSKIHKGQQIRQSTATENNDKDGFWDPLVPPVLHENYRSTRCAHCFGLLSQRFHRFEEITPRSQYLLLFCSTSCREAAQKYNIAEEERAISNIYERGGPPKVFSTAILVYRLLLAVQGEGSKNSDAAAKLNKLQHEYSFGNNNPNAEEIDEPSEHHSQAVVATVNAMMQLSTHVFVSFPRLDYVKSIVNRIKINGFAICDGENVALGVGVFGTPSFMNHSCRPNTIQTFLYGIQCQTPRLILTAHEEILPDQEVCISYVDNASPRTVRQQLLLKDYMFQCSCEACNDMQLEAKLVGLKCLECNSGEPAMPTFTMQPDPVVFKCDNCSNTDFQEQLAWISKLHTKNLDGKAEPLEELKKDFSNLKQRVELSSWYVQEAGELLAQFYLDLLSESQAPAKQQEAATKARAIFEELLKPENSTSASGVFRRHLNMYKAAKLDLFLNPDPRPAIARIETVKRFYSDYLPSSHEHMKGLEGCLQGGM